MRHLGRFACLLLVVGLLAGPLDGADKDKKGKAKGTGTPATAGEYTALLQMGKVTGKLLDVPSPGQTFGFEVDVPSLQPVQGGGNQAYRPRVNPRGGRGGRRPGQQVRPRLPQVRVTTTHKDFDLHVSDEVKVRFLELPVMYDDKGELKKFTSQELRELKGTGAEARLPGYRATPDDLKAGQVVQIYLHRKKSNDRTDPSDAMEVTTVIIVKDSDGTGGRPAQGKKNK